MARDDSKTGRAERCLPRPFVSALHPHDHFFGGVLGLVVTGLGPGVEDAGGVFGGWLGPALPPVVWFLLKTFVLVSFFVLLRAALPRPRYDQLMAFGWKAMLPLALVNVLVTGALVLAYGGPP